MTHVTGILKWMIKDARVESTSSWLDDEGRKGYTVKLAYFGGVSKFEVDEATRDKFAPLLNAVVSVQGEFSLGKDRKLICRSLALL